MELHTTFNLLRNGPDKCLSESRYRLLAKSLGGIRKYGLNTLIPLTKICDINGIDDAMLVLNTPEKIMEGETIRYDVWRTFVEFDGIVFHRGAGVLGVKGLGDKAFRESHDRGEMRKTIFAKVVTFKVSFRQYGGLILKLLRRYRMFDEVLIRRDMYGYFCDYLEDLLEYQSEEEQYMDLGLVKNP